MRFSAAQRGTGAVGREAEAYIHYITLQYGCLIFLKGVTAGLSVITLSKSAQFQKRLFGCSYTFD